MTLTNEAIARLRTEARETSLPGRRRQARVEALDLLALLTAYSHLRTVLLDLLEADESTARERAYFALGDHAA